MKYSNPVDHSSKQSCGNWQHDLEMTHKTFAPNPHQIKYYKRIIIIFFWQANEQDQLPIRGPPKISKKKKSQERSWKETGLEP
jgi:hypothetical protein